MSADVHVRFCERLGGKFPGATRLLLGFSGPRHEAEEIKERIGEFLRDTLRLELSDAKTLITHALGCRLILGELYSAADNRR